MRLILSTNMLKHLPLQKKVSLLMKQKRKHLNDILVPLIKEQGQSIHHAYINNLDSIMCSEKQIYNLIDLGLLDIKNQDLPRKIRYRKYLKRNSYYKN